MSISTVGVEYTFARALRDLIAFARIPSVSAQPEHAADVRRCADWLAAHLRGIGMPAVEVLPTPRHPAVVAAWRGRPGRPTVLIYAHYDVQPAALSDGWNTPPFEPQVRDGFLYGRGTSDDKGPLLAHVAALGQLLRSGGPPVNVVCLFDGEEEIGSPHLAELLERRRDLFAADLAVMSDTRFLAPGRPAIIYGLRGGLGLEIELRGQRADVHSGSFGGALHNPLQALCEIVARLHDPSGRVAIPGFYDRVRPVSAREQAALARYGPSDAQLLRDAGAQAGWGERGYTLYERTTIRPALTVNGLAGGYGGPGGKGIIPARATAKLSFRLVPDQEPAAIERLARAHLARLIPPAMRARISIHQRSWPVLLDPQGPGFRAAAAAYQRGFGAMPVLLRSGGSIPVVHLFKRLLGIPTVLMGFALPDDAMHGPNERFGLDQFARAITTCVAFLEHLGVSRER